MVCGGYAGFVGGMRGLWRYDGFLEYMRWFVEDKKGLWGI